jgi:hypothetical protein
MYAKKRLCVSSCYSLSSSSSSVRRRSDKSIFMNRVHNAHARTQAQDIFLRIYRT